MSSYASRYERGEYTEVWNELVAKGSKVFEKPLNNDAFAVALATMNRVRANVVTLHERLTNHGFLFKDPNAAFQLAESDGMAKFDAIEQEMGRLPLSTRAWYYTFASVCFEQEPNQLLDETNLITVSGLGRGAALVVRSIDEGRKRWINHLTELGSTDHSSRYNRPLLLVGPTLSNCDTAYFEPGHPDTGMDALEFASDIFDGDDATFVGHLRRCIRNGGFPYWKNGFKLPGFPSPDWHKLLPILTQGLRPF